MPAEKLRTYAFRMCQAVLATILGNIARWCMQVLMDLLPMHVPALVICTFS